MGEADPNAHNIQVEYPTAPAFVENTQMKDCPSDKPPEYKDTPGVAGMVPGESGTPGLAPPLAPGWQALPSSLTPWISLAVSPCPSFGTGDP